ncbi:MAG: zinc ABC transporter substrate-binding protein [Firmicutes bacterium]|nr:zinc ABC transporter substrate-binding protein [Bacillota bacterium]
MTTIRRAATLVLAALLGALGTWFLGLLSPSGTIGASPAGDPLRVVATNGVLADLAAQVGGSRVQVTSLVPAGSDPHTWEPSPRDAQAIATADVIIYNGLGLEPWLPRLLQGAAQPATAVIQLAEGIEPIAGLHFDVHNHEEGNPHLWLDVTRAMHYVRRIENALIEADPQGARHYRALARAYLDELEELDRWFQEQVSQIPPERRVLVTYHDAFAYMARRYGFEVAGVLVPSPDREPAASNMVHLVQLLRERRIPAVFVEPQIDPAVAQALAREAGVRVAVLYTDSLTADVPTYVAMMRANARALVEALR